MNFFSKVKDIFSIKPPLEIAREPLHFTDLAVSKINAHLAGLKAKSCFQVRVLYKTNSYDCRVGFTDASLLKNTIFEYPVKLLIDEKDEFFLRGSTLDFQEESQLFYIYPDIQIEVSNLKKNILSIYLNRSIIAENSKFPFLAIDKTKLNNSLPKYILDILSLRDINSLFIESNFISIEKNKFSSATELEDKVVDILLDYFTKCSYPLMVLEDRVETLKF
jgi:Fe-S cluster assembly iron-binding protein IscA